MISNASTSGEPSPIHPMARRAIQKKHGQHLVTKSEVKSFHCHLSFMLPITMYIATTQGSALKISGISCGINLKCWLCTRVSSACTLTLAQAYTNVYCLPSGRGLCDAPIFTNSFTPHTVRSSSWLSLSPYPRTYVSVKLRSRHNLNYSSEVQSTTA